MKWIGQHIYDKISRFRDDVFLEDVSSGTIASGGNLGLDSNNKIVKDSGVGATDLHGAGVDGANNQLLTDDGDGTVTSEANLTFDGSDLICASSLEGKPVLTLKTTHTAGAKNAELKFLKDADDASNGEYLGSIGFYGDNDAGSPEEIQYAKIEARSHMVADGGERGHLYFNVAENDGNILTSGLSLVGSATDGEIDVWIGAGAASVTKIAGTLTMGTTAAMTNAGLLSVANQSNITGLGTLESLTVTDIQLGEKRIIITGDDEDTFTITTGANGDTTMVTHDSGGTAGHFEIAADGDIILDSARQIKLEPAAGNNILLDGVLTVDAGVVIPVATAHNAAGTAVSIGAGATTAGTTNNIAGGNLTIHGGQGKGSGAGGDIIFQTANASGSGSSLNSLATALTISDDLSATFAGAVSITGALTMPDDTVTFAKASGVTPNVYDSKIKLIPSDFAANDDGGNTKFGVGFVEDASGGTPDTAYGMRASNSSVELFAFVSIPQGMKATHVMIYAKGNYDVEVFEGNIEGTAFTSRSSGGAANTEVDMDDVNATAINFLAISVNTTATTHKVYGGYVTIAAI